MISARKWRLAVQKEIMAKYLAFMILAQDEGNKFNANFIKILPLA